MVMVCAFANDAVVVDLDDEGVAADYEIVTIVFTFIFIIIIIIIIILIFIDIIVVVIIITIIVIIIIIIIKCHHHHHLLFHLHLHQYDTYLYHYSQKKKKKKKRSEELAARGTTRDLFHSDLEGDSRNRLRNNSLDNPSTRWKPFCFCNSDSGCLRLSPGPARLGNPSRGLPSRAAGSSLERSASCLGEGVVILRIADSRRQRVTVAGCCGDIFGRGCAHRVRD